jgi:hypothetical protein
MQKNLDDSKVPFGVKTAFSKTIPEHNCQWEKEDGKFGSWVLNAEKIEIEGKCFILSSDL